ncbi:FAD-dependent oxidoreductase [Clostridium sediminicola]|uniref:oxidoreductase n=1 Tax=Clostridium sediminicola TaxID=3114879 RepID=UPI003D163342
MSNILFTSSKINKMELKNRIIMSAMHLGYAQNKDVSKRDVEFYKARAKGGAAAIVLVAGVNDVSGPLDMHSVGDDKYVENLRGLSDVMHEYSSKLIVQLFHCGRNAYPAMLGGKEPISPSEVPSPIYKTVPKAMTLEEIKSTVEDFGKAAERCKKAGVDAVEISCSAGYLLTQFLSPLVNKRTDEYGGSLENRMRFPREVIKRVREYVGSDYPMILRISGSDMIPGGYGIDFMKKFCARLDSGLIDAISVTGGWHEAPVPQITAHLPEGGYAFLAEAIKRVVNIPVIACNRINNGEVAEQILQKGLADFVSCGRSFLADAEFVNKIREGKSINKCQACNKGCIERVLRGKDVRCAYNCRVGLEYIKDEKSDKKKKIIVVGGGPTGMEAARSAAIKGYDVILFTKEDKLGGLLAVATKPPHKQDISEYVEYMNKEFEKLNIDIRYNTKVDIELINSLKPEHVILAVGSTPIIPHIEGLDVNNVCFAEDVLRGNKDLLVKLRKGKTVIIGGGSVGLETAHFLAEQAFLTTESLDFLNRFVPKGIKKNLFTPLDITIIEMEKKVGKTLGSAKWILLNELKQLGVKIMTNTKVFAIKQKMMSIADDDGEKNIPADNIVLAIGYKPIGEELINYLDTNCYPYTVVGDAKKPKDVMEDLREAYEAVMHI